MVCELLAYVPVHELDVFLSQGFAFAIGKNDAHLEGKFFELNIPLENFNVNYTCEANIDRFQSRGTSIPA